MRRNMIKYSLLVAFLLLFSSGNVSVYAKSLKDPVSNDKLASKLTIGYAGSYLSSQYARTDGDLTAAIHYLRRVYNNDTGNHKLSMQLMGLLLLNGQVEEAFIHAKNSNPNVIEDPVTVLMQALYEVKAKKSAEVLKMLNFAESKGVKQLWLPLISAWTLASTDGLSKPLAIADLNKSIGRAAPIINYHIALINAHAGFIDAATQNFVDAVKDPKNPPTRVIENLLHFYNKNGKPAKLEPIVTAYVKAKEGRTLNPDTMLVDSLDAGAAEVLFTMGNVMQAAGITQDAIIYMQLVLYAQPDMDIAAYSLGNLYTELEMYSKSNLAYGRIEKNSKYRPRAMLNTAINYNKMGNDRDAQSILEKLERVPSLAFDAMIARADLLRIAGQYKKAASIYSNALKIVDKMKPQHWAVYYARAACYDRTQQWEKAEKDLLRALELQPAQPDILNFLGFSWLVKGKKIHEARAMIEQAAVLRPDDPQIVDSMGWALYLLGEYDKAEGYIERAITLIPSDPVVNDHLGDVYWRQGRENEARFQWERSISFSEDSGLEKSVKKKLKDGLPPLKNAGKVPVMASGSTGNPVP